MRKMKKGQVLMRWVESAEWRSYFRRESRKERGFLRGLVPYLFVWVLFIVGIYVGWVDADPLLRRPLWMLPLFALVGLLAMSSLFLWIPQWLFPQRTILREEGVDDGYWWGTRSWTPYSEIDSFWLEVSSDEGSSFVFLCWLRIGEEEEESSVIPRSVSQDEIRKVLSEQGLREVLSPDLSD